MRAVLRRAGGSQAYLIALVIALLGPGSTGCRPWSAPFVPTAPEVVRDMLRMAGVGPNDVVYDLGCGDGRIVIAAASQRGARGVGIDHNPRLVRYATERARRAHVSDRVRFLQQDFFNSDLRDATVVALYLYPHINLRLRPKLLRELRPGARVVSHRFHMADWHPDAATPVGGPRVYLWIIPADVSGQWRWTGPLGSGRLRIAQRFQRVTALLALDGRPATVERATLRGDRLTIVARRGRGKKVETFVGRVAGNAMALTSDGGTRRWTARR